MDHRITTNPNGCLGWTCTRSHAGMGWVTAGGGAKDAADARARLADHDAEYHGQTSRDCPICRDSQIEDTDPIFTATGTREEVAVMLRDHILDTDDVPHDMVWVVEYLLKEVK
ncbi:hypothetical protein NGM33_28710 [Nocardiopsis dassonvillei]|uniref:hypothetical protein n=1 Tax=Nocardiopsis dassonvillei TaxID=2014 RepID=UPI0020A3D821|nr:hypothetical protein [Nocardiopsis dassonvillei]MCP3017319.1 hypothetical protein [Nocardiopsis dassonvillei]